MRFIWKTPRLERWTQESKKACIHRSFADWITKVVKFKCFFTLVKHFFPPLVSIGTVFVYLYGTYSKVVRYSIS